MKIQARWNDGGTRVLRNIDHLTEHKILGLQLITTNDKTFNLNDIDRIVIQDGKYNGKPWSDINGTWIDCDPKGDDGLIYKCNIYGELSIVESNYCPRCGAFMQEDRDET